MNSVLDGILTLAKAALRSRPPGRSLRRQKGGTLVVMGNGPSLRQCIDAHGNLLEAMDTAAVNFAANTPEFRRLRPRHYVLADPHFFRREGAADPNVARLWENLRKADWQMTLHVPTRQRLPETALLPENVAVQRFNMTPGDGADPLSRALYRAALAMPRPRNVLIPALMEGIRDGYSEIYIVGADHSWPHTLYVDGRNRVVTVQPHFYKDNPAELDRIASAYENVRIHDILGSMATAFRSYHAIARHARTLGVDVYNATPDSLIDAFGRKGLEDLKI